MNINKKSFFINVFEALPNSDTYEAWMMKKILSHTNCNYTCLISFQCKMDLCVAKKMGFLDEKNVMIKENMALKFQSMFKKLPYVVHVVLGRCIWGNPKNYGVPSDCDITKARLCTVSNFIAVIVPVYFCIYILPYSRTITIYLSAIYVFRLSSYFYRLP